MGKISMISTKSRFIKTDAKEFSVAEWRMHSIMVCQNLGLCWKQESWGKPDDKMNCPAMIIVFELTHFRSL